MAQVGKAVRVGGSGLNTRDVTKGTHQNTAKVARRRANVRAEKIVKGVLDAPPEQADFLLPNRFVEVDPEIMEHVGTLLAGVQDYKVLRGSIAVLSLATSIQFAHLLTDAAMIGRGEHALVVDLWQIKRSDVFDDDEDDEDDGDDDG